MNKFKDKFIGLGRVDFIETQSELLLMFISLGNRLLSLFKFPPVHGTMYVFFVYINLSHMYFIEDFKTLFINPYKPSVSKCNIFCGV